MAYDHWGDYEKHLNALRNAQQTFDRDFAALSTRQRNLKTQISSNNPIVINRARSEFFRYLNAVENELRIVEQLARSSIGKLNSYIRNVKQFPQSGQHFNNLNGVINSLANNRRTLSQARTQASGF